MCLDKCEIWLGEFGFQRRGASRTVCSQAEPGDKLVLECWLDGVDNDERS